MSQKGPPLLPLSGVNPHVPTPRHELQEDAKLEQLAATPPTPHSRTTPATHGGHPARPARPMATGDATVPLIEGPTSKYLYASLGYSAAGSLNTPGAGTGSTGGRTLTASSGTGSTGGGGGTGPGGPAVSVL